MLKLEAVHTQYGPIEALKGVSLEVRSGEIVALIGANGAGKSTTLMTISGVLKPSHGKILFGEMDIAGWPNVEAWSRRLKAMPGFALPYDLIPKKDQEMVPV